MTEKETINYLKESIEHSEYNFENFGEHNYLDLSTINAISNLIDLYNKQKEENKKDIKGYSKMINSLEEQLAHKTKEIKELNLENQAFYEEMNCDDNEYISKKYSQLKENSISKDKVLKAIGYEENDEEYEKLKQDNEKLLAILDTIYSEFCRLEDIEDQKVEVAVAFIEEKRDKYWKDKIKDKIKELEEKAEKVKEHYRGTYACLDEYLNAKSKIQGYKELLEE